MRYIQFKLVVDLFIALLSLPLLVPLIALIAIIIKVVDGGPVFFVQTRVGYRDRLFKLIKFRTMVPSRIIGPSGDLSRVTRLGSFLRRTSLDELPSIYCILKGELSFVGPRPLLVDYLPLYTKNQRRRHSVRPGITGLAQVSGRNSIDWKTRFKLDIQYVDNINIALDLYIFAKTLVTIFLYNRINHDGRVSMPPLCPSDCTE